MASGKVLYSITVVVLGFICFVVGAIAVGLPNWGYFYSHEGIALPLPSYFRDNPNYDKGYFGPWRVCKVLLYNREKCGTDVSKFRPSTAVYIAGVVGAVGVTVLGVFCILSILQLAMISSKERVALKYTHLVMVKLALALLATLLSIAAAGLFAVQGEDRGFVLTRGEAFYVQIACIVINSLLFIMSVYDALFSRREGGDPTSPLGEPPGTTINNPGFKEGRVINSLLFIMSVYDALFSRREGGDPTSPLGEPPGTTINNPGFKEGRVINSLLFIMSVYDALFSRREGGDPTSPLGEPPGTTINNPGFKEGRGISMTDASGKPYSTNGHGSVASMNTTATTLTGLSDASTITRSPLRSSLKKPRPREGEPGGLGIHNPGYSGHSPPLNRNGSQKKVRIQTHSTEV